jgi:hypothetical protein
MDFRCMKAVTVAETMSAVERILREEVVSVSVRGL